MGPDATTSDKTDARGGGVWLKKYQSMHAAERHRQNRGAAVCTWPNCPAGHPESEPSIGPILPAESSHRTFVSLYHRGGRPPIDN
jgi:hypothetical protein